MAEVKEAPPPEPITQQPVPQPQPVDTPGPSYKQITAVTGTEHWTNDVFDCFKGDDNLCLKGFFCPCFLFGKTQARIRDPSLASYERINNDCLLCLTFLQRTALRRTYNIQGDNLTDCLFSAFCHCCVLIQQEKEVIGKNSQGVGSEGYRKTEGMSMGLGGGQ
ncbi:Protein PLANT CADMIUM RESISTANCE 2 [Lachnellula cervina]|uniref:Protein PLANT CADMIUM RESISTANCE 2 n=1 Tax=Lachnellula cervina TaxID=1316786 RepID=A0A7D8YLE8_9HELO|nr:Protein PLANT CADMIUM RESISTANCE 2 [Lachnellula cervina]